MLGVDYVRVSLCPRIPIIYNIFTTSVQLSGRWWILYDVFCKEYAHAKKANLFVLKCATIVEMPILRNI